MCEQEEKLGRKGALGRNYIAGAVAQAIISPIVGKLMDVVAKVNSCRESHLGCIHKENRIE